MRTRWLWVVVLAVCLPLAGALSLAVWRYRPRSFDRVAWRNDAEIGAGVRQSMADGLVANHSLIGRTREEVVEMLGEPPNTPYLKRYDLVYWLGDERGFISIDSEWLVIRIVDGRVIEAKIVTD
jgi:hypothetical protein